MEPASFFMDGVCFIPPALDEMRRTSWPDEECTNPRERTLRMPPPLAVNDTSRPGDFGENEIIILGKKGKK